MKRSTIFAVVVLVLAIFSLIISFTDYVLVALVTASLAGGFGLVLLAFTWRNKTSRYFSLLTIALSFYALLQFNIINEEQEIPDIKVDKGESEIDKRFESEEEEGGFELEDDAEPIE